MIVMHDDESRKAMDDGLVDAQSYAKAILNILDDFGNERTRLNDTQRAILNILDDSASEKARLEATQKAILNILDDFDIEKKKVEQVNVELRNEITERTRAEEALRHANAVTEEANRELEAFSYSASHDLRTPLRAIDGFSQVLLEDYADRLLDETGKDYLKRVRNATQRMAQIIDDMLKLSRITRAELLREEVDLSVLAQKIAAELQQVQPDRETEFIVTSGLRAHGDPKLLRIALENLLGNAWKFTGKRSGARIEFGMTHHDGETDYFVRDNGVGFDMAYADKLFGAFQRLHDSSEFPGTGIGLATAQRVIHKHGGKIWADGKVGNGATFYFTLPTAE